MEKAQMEQADMRELERTLVMGHFTAVLAGHAEPLAELVDKMFLHPLVGPMVVAVAVQTKAP